MCRLLGYCSRDAASVAELLGRKASAPSPACPTCTGTAGEWPGTRAQGPQHGSRPPGPAASRNTTSSPGSRSATSAWCTCAGPRPACPSSTSTPTRSSTATTRSPTTAPSTRRNSSARCFPPEWERRLAGTTDSERYFLHLMWRLAERDGDMVAAIADTTAAISRALHDRQPERDPAGARRAVRDLVLRPVDGPGRPVAGAWARRGPGRGRRLLRPGVPGHRRRRSGGELRLADARLDAAAVGARAGHRPAHARHVRRPIG